MRVAGPRSACCAGSGLHLAPEPPLAGWIDTVPASGEHGDPAVLAALLEFAVHDLGSNGIGAILIYRPDADPDPPRSRTGFRPRRRRGVRRPTGLAPLRHVLRQVDGAAIFDARGMLTQLGVRLVPSVEAADPVDGYRGMRHTSGRRYSPRRPPATVIVVSEDGPVTVLRNGSSSGVPTATDARIPEARTRRGHRAGCARWP